MTAENWLTRRDWRPLAPRPQPTKGPALGRQERATLIRQLAGLAAVLPISDAVATLARDPAGKATGRVLRHMYQRLQAGETLAAALPATAFPADVRAVCAAGEASGQLALVLQRLADSMDAGNAFRSRLVATLAYPALLVLVAVAVIGAMLAFVVPSIAAELEEAGTALPALTRAVLAISAGLARWWSVLAALVLALVGGLVLAIRRPNLRLRLDRALLAAPVLGPFLGSVEAVRWARLLATMLAAGLPLPEALAIVAPALHNRGWQQATRAMTDKVRAGASLSATLPLLPGAPRLLVALARSGEASGRLAPLLQSAAATLDRQLSDRSRTAFALAEPAIILVLGGVVALIILAVLLPILRLNTLAGAGLGGF